MHQAGDILRLGLFDELDGRGEVNAEVLGPVVGDRYLKVLDFAGVFEDVRKRGHVQDVTDVVLLQLREVFTVRGVAQEEARENFDGLPAIRLQRIVRGAFSVRRLGRAAAR